MSDRIERAIDVAAPIERVWRALTDYQEFGRWFRVALDQSFEVGKPSTGHITYPGYEHVKWEAVVSVMDAPHRFVFIWPHPADHNVDTYEGSPKTTVEFTLAPTPTGTRVTVVESGFESLPADRRADAIRQNEGGWTEQMQNIKAHVER